MLPIIQPYPFIFNYFADVKIKTKKQPFSQVKKEFPCYIHIPHLVRKRFSCQPSVPQSGKKTWQMDLHAPRDSGLWGQEALFATTFILFLLIFKIICLFLKVSAYLISSSGAEFEKRFVPAFLKQLDMAMHIGQGSH